MRFLFMSSYNIQIMDTELPGTVVVPVFGTVTVHWRNENIACHIVFLGAVDVSSQQKKKRSKDPVLDHEEKTWERSSHVAVSPVKIHVYFHMCLKSPNFMHNWGHRPTLVDVSGHVRACPSLFPTFPFPLWAATINFCVFRITFPSGEEWSVKSNLSQATDTQLQRMQLCQWQIIFWPLSLSLHGWRFANATACFLFSCSLPFCDGQRTSSKMLRCSSVWKTAWFFFFAALSPSLSVYFCCICLCQCNILIISFSVSLLPCLVSQLLVISCSLSVFPQVSSEG